MMTFPKVRKAVFPVAGLGSSFLPATKASPKVMLPIVDKPLIQYAVEEAIAAGCEELIFITGRGQRSVEDHFDKAYELENELALRQKERLLETAQSVLPSGIRCTYIRQPEALGLGDAVLRAQPAIGNEPFAVILADDLIDAPEGALAQLMAQYHAIGSSVVGVQQIDPALTESYGIVETLMWQNIARIHHIVEKPKPENTASNLGVIGRYILTPRIFDMLRQVGRGALGEVQLTDAIAKLLEYEPVLACPFNGTRYDCGNKLGYLEATVAYGLKHAETGETFQQLVNHYVASFAPASVVATAALTETATTAEDDGEWVQNVLYETAATDDVESNIAPHEAQNHDDADMEQDDVEIAPDEGMAEIINMLNQFIAENRAMDDEADDDDEEEPEAETAQNPDETVDEPVAENVSAPVSSSTAVPLPRVESEPSEAWQRITAKKQQTDAVAQADENEQKSPENTEKLPENQESTDDAVKAIDDDVNVMPSTDNGNETASDSAEQTETNTAGFRALNSQYAFGRKRYIPGRQASPNLAQ